MRLSSWNLHPRWLGAFGLFTCLMALGLGSAVLERRTWCLDSNLVEQLLYINHEGVSEFKLSSCRSWGWLWQSPRELSRAQQLRPHLKAIHQLEVLAGVLAPVKAPLTLILRLDQPFAHRLQGRVLELGAEWTRDSELQRTLLWAWLKQGVQPSRVGGSWTPLEREILAGFWLGVLRPQVWRQEPLWPAWVYRRSLREYCLSETKSPRHWDFCLALNNSSGEGMGTLAEPHIWSLLAWKSQSLWQQFKDLNLRAKADFLSNWTPLLAEALAPLLESELQEGGVSSTNLVLLHLEEYWEPDWLEAFAQWAKAPAFSGQAVALFFDRPPLHLNSGRSLEFVEELFAGGQEEIWLSCLPLDRVRLLESTSSRLHWVQLCPEDPEPRWGRLRHSGQWPLFLQQEPRLNFITFHMGSLRLAHRLSGFGPGPVNQWDAWTDWLQWQSVAFNSQHQLHEPLAVIEGIQRFRFRNDR